jgi:hypothetical protein
MTGVDEIVLPLYAEGLTTGEISAHFAEIYGPQSSRMASCRGWDALKRDVKPIYTGGVNAQAARAALNDLAERWASAMARSSDCGTRLGAVHPVPGLRHGDPQGPCAPPTRSSRSTPTTAGWSDHEIISRPSRPPSSASTWSPVPWRHRNRPLVGRSGRCAHPDAPTNASESAVPLSRFRHFLLRGWPRPTD